MKPSPADFQELYLGSLKRPGLDPLEHDIRFVEDNWESPTLGAWGLGWEVWLNGMEVSQFTYFQQAGGLECLPVTGEITYGIERLAMYIQDVKSVYDLVWSETPTGVIKYGDVFHQNEVEMSTFNFQEADVDHLFAHFDFCESEAERLVGLELPLPAYEFVMKASIPSTCLMHVTRSASLKDSVISSGCERLLEQPQKATSQHVQSLVSP